LPTNIQFILLDSSYEVVGREPVIVLWGLTPDGERVVLLDRVFRPYFYGLIARGLEKEADKIAARIRALSKPKSPIIDVSVVDKKYFGRPRKAARVTTVLPEAVREYREEVKRIEGVEDSLEADIRFAMRYIIDKHLYPFRLYSVPVEEIETNPGYRVDRVYMVRGEPSPLETLTGSKLPPDMRIVAFDIEVYSKRGSPNPLRDPVIR
jgi:DNA polymerase I